MLKLLDIIISAFIGAFTVFCIVFWAVYRCWEYGDLTFVFCIWTLFKILLGFLIAYIISLVFFNILDYVWKKVK